MATRTANTGSNNWNTNGAWVGGVQPTAADDVVIPASAVVTIPASTTVVGRSLTVAASGTIVGAATSVLNLGDATPGAGNVALSIDAGATVTNTGNWTIGFISTSTTVQTIASGGKILPPYSINGVGSKYQLVDTNTTIINTTINLATGTFDTNNQTCNWGGFSSNTNNTRTLTLGSSVINMISGTYGINNTIGITITANTAVVTLSAGSNPVLGIAGNMNGTSFVLSSSTVPTVGIAGGTAATVANLTRTGTAAKTDGLTFLNNVTITGTLTINGNSITNRLVVQSSVLGTPRTITAAVVVVTNADFSDIVGAGAGNWNLSAITGGSGDALGNTGITFTTAVPQAWQGTAGGNWDDVTKWTSRVPLPQDDVTISQAFSAQSINPTMPRLGRNIDCAGATGTFQLFGSPAIPLTFYGSLILASAITSINVGANALTFAGRGSHTVTWAGVPLLSIPTFNAPGGVYTSQDHFTTGVFGITLLAGTLDMNSKNVTANSSNHYLFQSTGAGVCILKMGSGIWTALGGVNVTFWNVINGNLIIEPGTSEIVIGATTATAVRTFVGGGKNYNKLTWTTTPTHALAITGQNTFDTLTIGPGRAMTCPSSLTTNVTNWNVAGTVNGYIRILNGGGTVAPPSAPDALLTPPPDDIDVRVRVALDTWNSLQFLASQVGGSAGNYGWQFGPNGTFLSVAFSTTGSNLVVVNSTAVHGFAANTLAWVRVARRKSDGRTRFYTASGALTNPVSGDWTQLGADIFINAATAIFDSTQPIEMGGRQGGQTINGNLYRVQIRNNILDDGTGVVLDADYTAKPFGANTFTESSSNAATVTIASALIQAGDGRVLLNSSTPGTQAVIARPFDDGTNKVRAWGSNTVIFEANRIQLPSTSLHYLWAPDTPTLSPSGDLDLRVQVAMTDWTPAADQTLVAKHQTNSQRSYFLQILNTGVPRFRISNDGALSWFDSHPSLFGVVQPTGVADGTVKWLRVTFAKATQAVKFYLSDDNMTWTPLGDNLGVVGYPLNTPIYDSTSQIEIGSFGGGTTSKLVGYVYRTQIRDNILDDGTGIVFDFNAAQRSTNTSDYLTIQDIKAGGAANWNAGGHSILVSNTTGWITTVSLVSTASDSFAMSDTAARTSILTRSAADTIMLSDIANNSLSLSRNASDVITINDAASRAIDSLRLAADVFSLSDFASRAISLERSGIDSLSLDDAATRVDITARSADDVFTLSDDAVRSIEWTRTGVDVWLMDDAGDVSVQRHRATEDAFILTDEVERLIGIGRTAVDTLSIVDSVTSWIGVVRFTEDAWDFTDEAVAYLGLIFLPGADGQTSVTRVGVIALTRHGSLAHARAGRIA